VVLVFGGVGRHDDPCLYRDGPPAINDLRRIRRLPHKATFSTSRALDSCLAVAHPLCVSRKPKRDRGRRLLPPIHPAVPLGAEAVPELNPVANIKLNTRVSLPRHADPLSSLE
jgi:hypothetical protein